MLGIEATFLLLLPGEDFLVELEFFDVWDGRDVDTGPLPRTEAGLFADTPPPLFVAGEPITEDVGGLLAPNCWLGCTDLGLTQNEI